MPKFFTRMDKPYINVESVTGIVRSGRFIYFHLVTGNTLDWEFADECKAKAAFKNIHWYAIDL